MYICVLCDVVRVLMLSEYSSVVLSVLLFHL